MNQGRLTNKQDGVLSSYICDGKSPEDLFFLHLLPFQDLLQLCYFSLFFDTFLENLLSLKHIHSYWISERIVPHLGYIASVIMSVVILQ